MEKVTLPIQQGETAITQVHLTPRHLCLPPAYSPVSHTGGTGCDSGVPSQTDGTRAGPTAYIPLQSLQLLASIAQVYPYLGFPSRKPAKYPLNLCPLHILMPAPFSKGEHRAYANLLHEST